MTELDEIERRGELRGKRQLTVAKASNLLEKAAGPEVEEAIMTETPRVFPTVTRRDPPYRPQARPAAPTQRGAQSMNTLTAATMGNCTS